MDDDAIAREALRRYDLDRPVTLELVRRGENSTYRVDAPRGAFALRVHRAGYRTPAMIRSEIAWMEALAGAGIATPLAVRTIDGAVTAEVGTPAGERSVSILTWQHGEPLADADDMGAWRALGRLMAEVRVHGETWVRPDWFERPSWDAEGMVGAAPHWGDPLELGMWSDELLELLSGARARVRERLAAFGTGPDRYGLVHADLAFANVLTRPDRPPVLIDFDDCGCSWYLWELAVALTPFDGAPEFAPRLDALVDGYRSRWALSDEDLAELPTFVMARRLVTLGWVFTHADTEHAARQRERRIATFPDAARRYLELG
ncbi:MAG: phosphotransferase enzyme family protein [Gaiellales bacterium]